MFRKEVKMEKITDVISSIANEKGLDPELIKQRVCRAFVIAAKKFHDSSLEYEAEVDEESKNIKLYQCRYVVAEDDERLDENNFLSVKNARKLTGDRDLEVGDKLSEELDVSNLGRTGVAIFFKEIEFQLEKLLEESFFNKYKSKEGRIVSGAVTQVDSAQNTWIEVEEVRALMPMKNRIKDEKFSVGQTLKAVVKSVRIDNKDGIKIELSRTSPKFLEALIALEVPEVRDGSISIKACARIPGRRAKVAISANRPAFDPVGAVVGVKGVRINAVSREIGGENIDIFEYSPKLEILLARALAPAIINGIELKDEKHAVVTIASDQKSKAIGVSGINIRLASMITGVEIELNEIGASGGFELSQEEKNEQGLKNLKALFGE